MGLLKRLRFKYKFVILNENTLEDKFHTRISMLAMMAWMGLFCLVSFALLSAIILLTPIKYMLPGYAEMSIREDVVNEALRVDSISERITSADRQMLILKNIIAGNIDIDSLTTTDTLTIEQLKTLPLGPTRQEQQFVEQYEETNRYNINDYIRTETRPEEIVFVMPVHGVISRHFNPVNRQNGITILTSRDKPVLAAQAGKIIFTTDNSRNNTLIICHDDGFITVYRQLGRLLHTVGDNVAAGQAIAFVGDEESIENNNTIDFELWHKAQPIDPEKYIGGF